MDNPFAEISERLSRVEELLKKFIHYQNNKDPKEHDEVGLIDLAIEVTKLRKSTIYTLVSKKQVPFHKRGGTLYFSKQELLNWILDRECVEKEQKQKPLFPNSKKYLR